MKALWKGLAGRKRLWAVVGLALALGALALLHADGFFGPRYQGRTARAWIRESFVGDAVRGGAARTALIRLGPEAVPELIDLLKARKRSPRHKLREFAGYLPPAMRRPLMARLGPSDVYAKFDLGADLLGEIGSAAAPAIPELIAAMREDNQEAVSVAAATLAKIGPGAIPPLAELTTATNIHTRHLAVYALGQIAPQEPQRVVPLLLGTLTNYHPFVLEAAVHGLANSGHAGLVVLLREVANGGPETTALVVEALARHPNTKPGFMRQLNDLRLNGEPGDRPAAEALFEALRKRGDKEGSPPRPGDTEKMGES